MNKLKNKKYGSTISLLLMIIISITTQIVTLLKTSVVAGYFGTTAEMDAYNFAYSIVGFIFGFIAAAISTVIIPCYVEKKPRQYLDSFITILYGLLLVVIAFILIFRIQLIEIITNRDAVFSDVAGNVLIILMLSNFVLAVTNITTAYYQCIGKYNIPKIINLFSQVIVVFALIICKDITIYQYALILSAGILLNFTLDVGIAIKLGWRYFPTFDLASNESRHLFKLFLPIVFSTGVYKLSLMVDSTIASRLDVGKITVLTYSGQISTMVNSILIGNLLTFIYPKIIKHIHNDDNQALFWRQTSLFHLIVCAVIVGFFAVGKEGIALFFQHGKFGHSSTIAVYYGALIYIFGQQTNIIRDLIYRYFYAKGDTKTAAKNSVIVSVVNITTSLILVYLIGFYGIIIGTVTASFVSLTCIFLKFKRKFGLGARISEIILPFLKNIGVTIITAIVLGMCKALFPITNNALCVLVFGTETVLVFILLSVLLRKSVIRVLWEL